MPRSGLPLVPRSGLYARAALRAAPAQVIDRQGVTLRAQGLATGRLYASDQGTIRHTQCMGAVASDMEA